MPYRWPARHWLVKKRSTFEMRRGLICFGIFKNASRVNWRSVCRVFALSCRTDVCWPRPVRQIQWSPWVMSAGRVQRDGAWRSFGALEFSAHPKKSPFSVEPKIVWTLLKNWQLRHREHPRVKVDNYVLFSYWWSSIWWLKASPSSGYEKPQLASQQRKPLLYLFTKGDTFVPTCLNTSLRVGRCHWCLGVGPK